MTAANEKPTIELLPCPFCGGEAAMGGRHDYAFLPIAVGVDMSRGDDMTARAYLYEGGIMHVKYEPPSQPATGSITATCETTSNLPYTVGQTAEAVDDAEYTQGFAYDGVVILKDGQPITIDEVLAMLNARARGGK